MLFRSVTGVVTSFDNITTLFGSALADTLTGDDQASFWNLDVALTYTNAGATRTLEFSLIENLQGSSAVDTFNVLTAQTLNLLGGSGADVFDIDAALSGSVNGEAGSDTLQGNLVINAAVTGSAANGYSGTANGVSAGYLGINVITGGGGTLTGRNAASTWALAATTTYSDGGAGGALTFTGFTNLQGGSGVDTFNVTGAGASAVNVLSVNVAKVEALMSNVAPFKPPFTVPRT